MARKKSEDIEYEVEPEEVQDEALDAVPDEPQDDPDIPASIRMAAAVAKFDKPSVSSRTMLLDQNFWFEILKAMKG